MKTPKIMKSISIYPNTEILFKGTIKDRVIIKDVELITGTIQLNITKLNKL